MGMLQASFLIKNSENCVRERHIPDVCSYKCIRKTRG